jgi:hypothetical protein
MMNWKGARNAPRGLALVGMACDLAQADRNAVRTQDWRGVTEAPF